MVSFVVRIGAPVDRNLVGPLVQVVIVDAEFPGQLAHAVVFGRVPIDRARRADEHGSSAVRSASFDHGGYVLAVRNVYRQRLAARRHVIDGVGRIHPAVDDEPLQRVAPCGRRLP